MTATRQFTLIKGGKEPEPKLSNREAWREIIELLVDRAVPKDEREKIAQLLDEHFVIQGRGKR